MSQQEIFRSVLASDKGISDSFALSPFSVSYFYFYYGAPARQ